MVRVALEGLIGVGKSTVLNILKEDYGYDVAPEPVDQWTLLEQFYDDRKKYALAFETQVLCSYAHKNFTGPREPMAPRVRAGHAVAHAAAHTPHSCDCAEATLVLERSPDSAYWVFARMLFEQGCMSEDDLAVLKRLYDTLPVAHVDHVVYLSASVETCMQRLAWRDRANESRRVSEQYLKDLDSRYLEWLRSAHIGHDIIQVEASEGPADVARRVAKAILSASH
jgi:deoxyadenosine/deoxycytidine kinase